MKFVSTLTTLACAVFAGSLCSCNEDPDPTLFYFAESDGTEAGASFTFMYKGRPFEKSAILTINQLSKFRSSMSSDGSFGVTLYTSKEYIQRLYAATAARPGKLLLPVFNGLAYEPVRITQPITDGTLVIWNGVNGYDLRLLSAKVEPADKDMEEKRYLKDNPRPLPDYEEIKNQKKDITGRTIAEIPAAR